ncbi:hypothetical protein C0Q70_05699 [Pomacea canaliculata]|uniref:Uncharacterized protein n=1 Tax=Pomacea canaliculata TaxID=400727 RepID=A0A2T7PLX5_POMCA|nr:hypothetical protein C0Q70_05699 [Pomacea canaliculata]
MLDYNEKVDNWSIASATSSRTDLSVFDVTDSASPSPGQPDVEKKGNSASRAVPRLKGERPGSVASSRSDVSTAQRSVKAMNLKNAHKTDSRASEANQVKKSSAKSSIPPLTPRRAENKATPSTKQQPPPPERASSASATRKPATTRVPDTKSGASSGRPLPKRSTLTCSNIDDREEALMSRTSEHRDRSLRGSAGGAVPVVTYTRGAARTFSRRYVTGRSGHLRDLVVSEIVVL